MYLLCAVLFFFFFLLFFSLLQSQSTLYDRLTRVLRSIPLNERHIAMIIFSFINDF